MLIHWTFALILALFVVESVFIVLYPFKFQAWVILISGWVVSVGLHEFSHAFVAWRFTENKRRRVTGVAEGRILGATLLQADETPDADINDYLSLNLLKFVDPMQTIILPLLLMLFGGIALPGGSVLLSQSELSRFQRALVSAAGPAANFVFGWIVRVALLLLMFGTGALRVNVEASLAPIWSVLIVYQGMATAINLLPLPPLDGFTIFLCLLPQKTQETAKTLVTGNIWRSRISNLLTFSLVFFLSRVCPQIFYGLIAAIQKCYFISAFQWSAGLMQMGI